MIAAEQHQRTWTEVGAEYTGAGSDREKIEAEIADLTWKQVDGTTPMMLPFSPGEALKTLVTELHIPKVTAVAHDGYLQWPDGPETAHFGIYGIEGNYANGRARIYALDRGVDIVVLAHDLFTDDEKEA